MEWSPGLSHSVALPAPYPAPARSALSYQPRHRFTLEGAAGDKRCLASLSSHPCAGSCASPGTLRTVLLGMCCRVPGEEEEVEEEEGLLHRPSTLYKIHPEDMLPLHRSRGVCEEEEEQVQCASVCILHQTFESSWLSIARCLV